jgi:hypothetical protein
MSDLARELLKLGSTEQLRSATALVTSASPFTIELHGVAITDPPRLSSYTPAVDDVVLVLRPDTALVVVGDIV